MYMLFSYILWEDSVEIFLFFLPRASNPVFLYSKVSYEVPNMIANVNCSWPGKERWHQSGTPDTDYLTVMLTLKVSLLSLRGVIEPTSNMVLLFSAKG